MLVLDSWGRAVRALPVLATLTLTLACDGDDGDDSTSGGTTTEGTGTDGTDGTSGTGSTGDGTTTGATGTTTGASGSTGTPVYSHATDIQPVWTAACVNQCHDSACATPDTCDPLTQNLDLPLDGDAYDNLVNVMSVQNPSMLLVRPDDPDASYLWHKIAGTHDEVCSVTDCKDQMPKDADPLDAGTQQMINDWIAGGALP